MGLMMVPFVKRASCTKEVWQKPRSACDRLYCLTKHNINAICTVLHTNRFHTSINSPQAETTKKCLMLSGNQKKKCLQYLQITSFSDRSTIYLLKIHQVRTVFQPQHEQIYITALANAVFSPPIGYKQIDITTVWMRLCLEKVSTVEIWDHCLSLKACDHSYQIISFCQACCHSQ